MIKLNKAIFDILRCPLCSSNLEAKETYFLCMGCKSTYGIIGNKQIDLRLKKDKKISVPFTLSPSFVPDDSVFHGLPFKENSGEIMHIKGIRDELASHFPLPTSNSSTMLDLGCGEAKYRTTFEQRGFIYVGIDYYSKQSDFLADAHALPFKNDSFEFIFSRAVFEHLQYPFVAAREAFRVLKSGSKFIGSVAFLEPFHGCSLYHQTHYGVLNCLAQAGFKSVHISPNSQWDVLTAQAAMSLFPGLPFQISQAIVSPLKAMHEIYWRFGHLIRPQDISEFKRQLWTAGSFEFVAEK